MSWSRRTTTVTQRVIETLIGRLLTDEQFRADFTANPEWALLALRDRGIDLSNTEIAALVNTDPDLWERAAESIDPRLQKASLKGLHLRPHDTRATTARARCTSMLLVGPGTLLLRAESFWRRTHRGDLRGTLAVDIVNAPTRTIVWRAIASKERGHGG